jgi:hypothetical protein
MIQQLGSLQLLDISTAFGLTAEDAQHIVQYCRSLRVLRIQRLHWQYRLVTFQSGLIDALAETGLRELQVLNISKLEDTTDELVAAAAKGCPQLQELAVTHSPRLTDACITPLMKHAPSLRVLHCRGCPGITHTALQALSASNPLLRISADLRPAKLAL